MKDPLDFTPHQAVNVSFTWDGQSDKVYAILCQDYMNEDYGPRGFEYVDVPTWDDELEMCCYSDKHTLKAEDCYGNMTKHSCPTQCAKDKGYGFWETPNGMAPSDRYPYGCGPWVGDGSLLAEFSDGTKTNKDWKVYSTAFGPTDESIGNGCSYKDFRECIVEFYSTPDNCWTGGRNCNEEHFDDSNWVSATEFSAAEAGWGQTPIYNHETGECCGILSQGRTKAEVECVELPESQCLNPKEVLCSNGEASSRNGDGPSCDGPKDPHFIWASDLQHDQIVLFRYVVPGPSTTITGSSTGQGGSNLDSDDLSELYEASSGGSSRIGLSMGKIMALIGLSMGHILTTVSIAAWAFLA